MTEHKVCIGCIWNNYPTCKGTIMEDGSEMDITTLREGFQCGQKDNPQITDFSIKIKTEIELIQEKNAEFETRIAESEAKTAALEAKKDVIEYIENLENRIKILERN